MSTQKKIPAWKQRQIDEEARVTKLKLAEQQVIDI
jgi:hypothetical protein